MTKRIKELEEARKAIMAILNAEDFDIRRGYYVEAADQILNLKGDGWRIAIISDEAVCVGNLRYVVWQGGGE